MRLALSIVGFALVVGYAGSVRAVTCSNVSFGTINLGTYSGTTITGGVTSGTATCPNSFAYGVGFSAGAGTGATTTVRQLTGPGGATLAYSLFRDSALTLNLGNSYSSDTINLTGTGSAQSHTVYPRVAGGQYPVPGTYNDTVIDTLFNTSPLVTTTVTVIATVQAACTITASALAFGTYTGSQTDATSSLTVTCTNTTPYYVNLSDGANYGAGFNRFMAGPGGAKVGYFLYQDSARSVKWGNTYNYDGKSGTGSGSAQVITVYGRVGAGNFVTPGLYSDTVIAKVTF